MTTVTEAMNTMFAVALNTRFPALNFEFIYSYDQDLTIVRVTSKLEVSKGQFYEEAINLNAFSNEEFIQKMILIGG